MKLFTLSIASFLIIQSVFSQNIDFTEVSGTPFPGLHFSSVAFADVDGDGDQDVLITGNNNSGGGQQYASLYVNDGSGSFSLVSGTPFDRVQYSAIAFGDVDGDNDQDVIITGMNSDSNGQPSTILYTNDGTGTFTKVTGTPFQNVERSAVALADLDGDNDLDLIISGDNSINPITRLYSNDGSGVFTSVANAPFAGAMKGSITIADVNGDTLPDVFITGENSNLGGQVGRLYTNDGALSFTQAVGSAFPSVLNSSVAFADIDGDNDQDIMITGQESFPRRATLMTNDGAGIFTEVTGTPFLEVSQSSIAFADVDMDNDQDLLITGSYNFNASTMLYSNDSLGNFDSVPGLPFEDVFQSSVAFADIDGDQDQDLLITGLDSSGTSVSRLYLNISSGTPVSVDNDIEKNSVEVFPNPAFEYLNIQSSQNIDLLSICSSTGKLIFSEKINQKSFSVDISSIPQGIYILRMVNSGGQIQSQKIFIQH